MKRSRSLHFAFTAFSRIALLLGGQFLFFGLPGPGLYAAPLQGAAAQNAAPLQGAAALQAPDFAVQEHPSASGKLDILDIQALAPAGHHFNLNAPMYFQWLGAGGSAPSRLSPLKKNGRTLEFVVAAQNSARDFEISAYLCDDKETYCERHSVRSSAPATVGSNEGSRQPQIASGSGKPQSAQPSIGSAGASAIAQAPVASALEPAPVRVHGFILNDPEAAFQKAKKLHRLVMIDFFGIWCPPCNELDEHVFSTPRFQKETSGLVRLKLDVDAPVSWSWKAKYAIQGYPTIIFANPRGDEVGRIVGFRALDVFLADTRQAVAESRSSFSKLQKAADSGDRQAAARLGLMEYDRANWAEAEKYLSLADDASYREQIAESQIGVIQDEIEAQQGASSSDNADLNTRLVQALEKSIRDFPDTPDSIDRRMQLADLYAERKQEPQRKQVLIDAVQAARELMANPSKLENKDCTKGDLWESIGVAYQELGDPTAAKQAFVSGAQEYRSLMKSNTERGYNLELAFCLWNSGDIAGAEAVYEKLQKLYPREFTFFFDQARMYHALQRDSEARPLAETAYARSYGDNRLRSGKLLADILEAQGKKGQALSVARRTLTEVKLPKDSSLRAHRYAKQLQDLISRLEKPKAT